MNKFYKVSKDIFVQLMYNQVDVINANYQTTDNFETNVNKAYDESIRLPKRATKFSAGYDFFAPYGFTLAPNDTITIPTGVKVQLDDDKFLAIVPRSSLGFKYRCQLNNTVGIIDSDYFNNEKNEGLIFIRMTNNGDKAFTVNQGEAFCQGIILQYFLTEDDSSSEERRGGIGSTNK